MHENQIPTLQELNIFERTLLNILGKKPILREIKGYPILYVGDLHGYYSNLKAAFRVARLRNAKNLVLLGDYIDRGPEQISCALNAIGSYAISEGLKEDFDSMDFIDPLFKEKKDFHVIALRGNHDDKNISAQYDFLDRLLDVYENEKETSEAFNLFDRIFRLLPFGVETEGRSLALHGGIPNFIDEEKYLKFPGLLRDVFTPSVGAEPIEDFLPRKDPQRELKILLGQIVWNDALKIDDSLDPQFLPSMRGEGIFEFNKGAWLKFSKMNNYRRLIRAHDSRMGPYDVFWDNQLVHIFSAYPYFDTIDKLAFFLEYNDGTGEIVDGSGATIKKVDKPMMNQ